jgi:hypothetical protein
MSYSGGYGYQFRGKRPLRPGIENRLEKGEVRNVTSDEGQAMNLGGGSQKCVHHFRPTPEDFGTTDYPAAGVGYRWIDGQNPSFET